jgi:hypothetical protein
MMTEMRTLGQEKVFSCTMDGTCKSSLCSVMTSSSTCEHMWSIEGWTHNKRRNRLTQPNVEKDVRPQEGYAVIQTGKVCMGLSDKHQ